VIIGDPKVTSQTDPAGYAMVDFPILEEDHSYALLTFMLRGTLWVILYGIVFGIIALAYHYVPISQVGVRASLLGAGVATTLLIGFVIGFQVWVTSFANTDRLYGVWAVIPVGMMLLLVCNQILFFGLELACVIDERRDPSRSLREGAVRRAPVLRTEAPLVPAVTRRSKARR